MNRRQLLKSTGLAAGAPAVRAAATDRIGVGIIGCGGQGTWDQRVIQSQPDVEVVAVCDVYRPNLERALALAGGKAKTYHDYRRLLEDRNVQAVVIATPEHWHALMCIDACEAGKDVYVEKPASHNIRDGRLMVEAARRNQRVVQVGSQQRSGSHFQRAVKFIQDGKLGRIHYATCWNHSASAAAPASREATATQPPPDLDYNLWLGPAPKRPFAEVWGRGRRLLWDFYGGMLTEWGSHMADVVLWAMGVRGPRSVLAAGGLFQRKEGELPDTLQVTYEYDDFLFHYSVLSHNGFGPNGDPGSARFGSYGIQFQGTKGTLFVDRAGYRVTPQMTRHEDPAHPPRPLQWYHDERQFGYYYTTDCLPSRATAPSSIPRISATSWTR